MCAAYPVHAILSPRCLGALSSCITMDLPMIDLGPDNGKFESVNRLVLAGRLSLVDTTFNRPNFLCKSPTSQRCGLSDLQSL